MMPADQIVIAIRRIIVRGGSTLEILRFLDDASKNEAEMPEYSFAGTVGSIMRATDPDADGTKPQRAESYEFDAGGNPCETDADLDVPLGEACRIDDPECEACQ